MSNSRFAICLFEEGIELQVDEILVGQGLQKIEFKEQLTIEATLYQRKADPNTPSWVKVVEKFADIEPSKLKTSSSGAILFMKINDRVVGCCFGSSVTNVNRNNIESDFGLGVAYAKVGTNQVKSVESFLLGHNPITNHKSAAIASVRNDFNIDNYLENITELSGYQYKENRRTLIKGKEFFSCSIPLSLQEIISLCKDCLAAFIKAKSDPLFEQLTSIRKVKDRILREKLDKELINLMNNRSQNVHLVDFESFQDINHYKLLLTKGGSNLSDISIDDIYDSFRNEQSVNIGFLNNRKVYVFDSDNQALSTWTLYKCLFTEVKLGKQFFIIYKGKWYEIDENYLSGLKEFISDYEVDDCGLPAWNGTDNEGIYNEHAAATIKGQCWDKKLYSTETFSYGIEFCDILDSDYIFHVKKYKGSALNSHLLLQTAVSAQLLAADPKIKQWIFETSKKEFKKHMLVKKDLSLLKETPCYCIVLMTKNDKRLSEILPFFSLISFNLMIRRIVQLGYEVRIAKV